MLLHSKVFGDGHPLLILHGFLGTGDNWKSMGLKFSKIGLQIHLIDQRNHGRSFHSNIFNYNDMAKDLKYYCNYHDIKKCTILGHSMGGKTAMFTAANYPEIIEKIIIADISPGFYPVHHLNILNGLLSLDFNTIKSRKQADKKLSELIFDQSIRQFLLKNLCWNSVGNLSLRPNLKILKENIGEIGKQLPCQYIIETPTLFLKAELSDYINDYHRAKIFSQFTNSSIETISNAGHWLHVENSHDFFLAVKNFLAL